MSWNYNNVNKGHLIEEFANNGKVENTTNKSSTSYDILDMTMVNFILKILK
jgi:hypothetical protein